jgi:hypothetical protein
VFCVGDEEGVRSGSFDTGLRHVYLYSAQGNPIHVLHTVASPVCEDLWSSIQVIMFAFGYSDAEIRSSVYGDGSIRCNDHYWEINTPSCVFEL